MSKWIWLLALVALAACKDESGTGVPTQPEAGTAAGEGPVGNAEDPAAAQERKEARAAAAASREKCVDTWLLAHGLNEYGDPPDTMYTGGTPLFDERTGERADRVEHVMSKHPALRDTCR